MKKWICLIIIVSFLFASGCAVSNDTVSEDVSEYSCEDDFSEDISEISEAELSPEENEFLTEAKELLKKDEEITKLIILNGISEGEKLSVDGFTPYLLSEANEYHDYSSVLNLLGSVYIDEWANEVIDYPEYGPRRVSDIDGVTGVCTHFVPQFNNSPNEETIIIESLEEDKAVISVRDQLGSPVIMHFTKTQNGWRLNESFFSLTYEPYLPGKKSTSMDVGSASALKGKCLVINVFVDDAVSSWKAVESEKVIAIMDDACGFLKNMASYYGCETEIYNTGRYDSLYITTKNTVPTDMDQYVWMDALVAETVYGTVEKYASSHYSLKDYDNYCLVFHVNKKGRSYAVQCNTSDYSWKAYTAERCAIFHTNDTKYAYYDSIGVYVHEILHLFGANDLYEPYITESENKIMTEYFPNCIMRTVPNDIGMASVSPYTAYCIGWVKGIKDQFMFLN